MEMKNFGSATGVDSMWNSIRQRSHTSPRRQLRCWCWLIKMQSIIPWEIFVLFYKKCTCIFALRWFWHRSRVTQEITGSGQRYISAIWLHTGNNRGQTQHQVESKDQQSRLSRGQRQQRQQRTAQVIQGTRQLIRPPTSSKPVPAFESLVASRPKRNIIPKNLVGICLDFNVKRDMIGLNFFVL